MKTTLKTAKFIFKTAVTRCVATNAVAVSCILVANAAVGGDEMANWIVDFGGLWCGNGCLVVWLRGFCCLVSL